MCGDATRARRLRGVLCSRRSRFRRWAVSGLGMSGYTPDEKLRLQQLRVLRRRWLKDQELSPREPVLPPPKLGPVARFWERFLQPGSFWRLQVSEARLPFPRGVLQPCSAEGFPPWGSLDPEGSPRPHSDPAAGFSCE